MSMRHVCGCVLVCLALPIWGATFGTPVAIGGEASDIALDEPRSSLYVANFSANRIEVRRTGDLSLRTSINVAPQPGSLALSPDGRYLLITHFGNFQAPDTPQNALTLIDLTSNGRQTFGLGSPPLGAAFGADGLALVVTTSEFLLFDPASGSIQLLNTIQGVTASTLPAPPASFPPQIIAASLGVSGNGLKIYGLTDTIRFSYDVTSRQLVSLGYQATPPLGPRVVSVNRDGSLYALGWALFDATGTLIAQFPNATGLLNVGSHVIDSARNLIYAQIPQTQSTTGSQPASTASTPPVLMILDSDNLTVRDQLQLPENLAGRSLLSSDGSVMYSVSDSGVLALPVGALSQSRRLAVSQEDVVLLSGFCDRSIGAQTFTITNLGNEAIDFTISGGASGITVTPSTGKTPATIQVTADPTAFQNRSGTVVATLQISSAQAVNLPLAVRVLVNVRDADQRGTVVNVPGKVVDLLADPARDRFYVLRQDRNQVLVFDGSSQSQIAVLRTGNTPTQMAFTLDRHYLVVGNDNSSIANVFDLESLQPTQPIRFPLGHYPRSLAFSGSAILAACRRVGTDHSIDQVDWNLRSATALPSLGAFQNKVDLNTILTPTPNGSSIVAAEADGNVLLYDASAGTFTVSRKDFTALAGPYAASGSGQFVIGDNLLNASLVLVKGFDASSATTSGFAFMDQGGIRSTVPAAGPGVVERMDLSSGSILRPTRMVETPLTGSADAVFMRALAPLSNGNFIVALTTSGLTVLTSNYDASVPQPLIDRVVNAADLTQPVAPGGLISVFGQNMSPVNAATQETPLPTALAESCLTANGTPVPFLFVSPAQINAQLPFTAEGDVTLVLHSPGGISDNFQITVLPAAPSVFRSGTAGPETGLPTVLRVSNNQLVTLSNPVHRGDTIVIYTTGLGRTSPQVDTGAAAPANPLAWAAIAPAVDLGGVSLSVLYAGLTPGEVGVYQINVQVPQWAPLGMSVPLTIAQGTGSTSLPVRVID